MLSADRIEFRRVCDIELNRATVLTGAFDRMTQDQASNAKQRLFAIANDMAESLPARIPHDRVQELFRVARAHYARVPSLRDLQMAWDNHMRPQDAPAPKDAPRLPPPTELPNSEAKMRHLAAVRTSLAEGGRMMLMTESRDSERRKKSESLCEALEALDWMADALSCPPSKDEVTAMANSCTENSLAFYRRRPDLPPNWGYWMDYYGICAEK